MSDMGVAATVRVEQDVCLPSPHRHASGHSLTGQWANPFITWEKPVTRLAAAQRLEQLERVGADADGSGLAPLAEEANVAAFIQRLDAFPAQPAKLRHPAAQKVEASPAPTCCGAWASTPRQWKWSFLGSAMDTVWALNPRNRNPGVALI